KATERCRLRCGGPLGLSPTPSVEDARGSARVPTPPVIRWWSWVSNGPPESNLTHLSGLAGSESLSASQGRKRIHGQKNGPGVGSGCYAVIMDRATHEQLLQEAESLLHRGERNIAHQREVIGTLERGGH